MWHIELTKERKIILLAGVILLALAAGYRLVPFLRQSFSGTEEVFSEQRIVKLQKKAQQKEQLDRQLQTLSRQLSQAEAVLLGGATYSLAAVEIQNLLYDLAKQHGFEIKSVRVMNSDKPDDKTPAVYAKVSVQAQIELSTGQLKELLYGVAKAAKIIRVENIEINPLKRGQADKLTATMTLTGLMRNEKVEG
ncbi:MAG: type II secretion system protein M [Proteobacteria bacterium]|nr:type II secretion system protein M [Pseudomonadota bacterium]MBU1715167.1 type II secretion system protein M [Pseudomonadota bacterium]